MTIRRVPEDFAVEEVTGAEFLAGITPSRGTHAVFRLKKTSLTTPDAVAFFAKASGVKPGVVDYAGLKDKHAVTVQMVSIPWGMNQADPTREVSGRGWSAEFAGWSARGMTAEAIEGNRFVIMVRDLSRKAAEEMEERSRDVASDSSTSGPAGGSLVFINYFGEQRFGSARHGKGFAAKHLVHGEFEDALKLLIATPARKDSGKRRAFTRVAAEMWGDWKGTLERLPRCAERGAIETLAAGKGFRDAFAALPHFDQQMCVEAYQSELWNRIAEKLARHDPTKRLVGQNVPMLATGVTLLEPWRAAAEEVLLEEGLELEQLRIPGLRRPAFGIAERPLLAQATGFSLGPIEQDELSRPGRVKRVVRFALPRGAYATVLLRALGQ